MRFYTILMGKNNFYIFLGAWIAILPFTGIPGVWRNGLVSTSGLILILVVIGPTILKKLNKQKTKRRSKTSADSYIGDSNATSIPTKLLDNENSVDE